MTWNGEGTLPWSRVAALAGGMDRWLEAAWRGLRAAAGLGEQLAGGSRDAGGKLKALEVDRIFNISNLLLWRNSHHGIFCDKNSTTDPDWLFTLVGSM